MGIDAYALTSALNGIWAQRLVRLVCPVCAGAYQPEPGELAGCGLTQENSHDYRFRRGKGCGACRGSGYRGRRAIAEILTLNDRLRELIATRQPAKRVFNTVPRVRCTEINGPLLPMRLP